MADDLSFTLKEYMERVEDNMKDELKELKGEVRTGFELIKKEIKDMTREMEEKYARKTSVNRLWYIAWSIISFGAINYGKQLVDLLSKYK